MKYKNRSCATWVEDTLLAVAKIEVVYDPAPKSLLTVFLYCFKPFSANKQTKKITNTQLFRSLPPLLLSGMGIKARHLAH
jgi:hypothetical protein